jgi:hypothetical protein
MERFLKGYRPSPAKQPRLAESWEVTGQTYVSNTSQTYVLESSIRCGKNSLRG